MALSRLPSNQKALIPANTSLICNYCNTKVALQPRKLIINLNPNGCSNCHRDGTERKESSMPYSKCNNCITNYCIECINFPHGHPDNGKRAGGGLQIYVSRYLRKA